MRTVQFLGVDLDVCPTTGGIWFDEGEFGRMRRAINQLPQLEGLAQPEVENQSHRGVRMCPNCGTALDSYRFLYSSPVELDGCGRCNGMWVDDGEIDAMVAVLQRSKSAPPLTEEAAQAIAQMGVESEASIGRAQAVTALIQLAVTPVRRHFF